MRRRKMVSAQRGVLIHSDPQMREFLLHLDETNALGTRFVIEKLDSTHLFIDRAVLDRLVSEIDDLMDRINFVEA